MKVSTISIVLILLAFSMIAWGIVTGVDKHISYEWVCPDEVAAQHRAFVVACAMHSSKGVRSCTTDADMLFCIKQEIPK